MIKRLLLSFALSMVFLLACVILICACALYPNTVPRWLELTLFLSIAWPLEIFSSIFPNTGCPFFEECGRSEIVYLLTLVTTPLVYTGLFYGALTYRERLQKNSQHAEVFDSNTELLDERA